MTWVSPVGWHRLKGNARNTSIPPLVFVDTEALKTPTSGSQSEEQTLRLGVAHHWTPTRSDRAERLQKHQFRSSSDFWDWCCSKVRRRQRLWVVAHNASYDARILDTYRELGSRGYVLVWASIDETPFILRWQERCSVCGRPNPAASEEGKQEQRPSCGECPRRTLLFISSTNYAPVRLATLGESIGTPKSPMPPDNASEADWFRYCEQDVTVLREWFTRFLGWLQANNCGNLGMTAASQAWNAYRHAYSDAPLFIHRDPGALELERSAYKGGRCEAYRLGDQGKGLWYQLDCNSLYPAVMYREPMPVKLIGRRDFVPLHRLPALLDKYAVIADVKLVTDQPAFPLTYDGRLVFPVGTFRTTLATPELRLAVKLGAVNHIYGLTYYERQPIFRQFVSHFYRERLKAAAAGDVAGELVGKLLLNALSGKFGQRRTVWRRLAACDPEEVGQERAYLADEDRWTEQRWLGGSYSERQQEGETASSMPSVAAHITSAGRAYLWSLIQIAGASHVLYVDTDSLIVDYWGYVALADQIHPTRLGSLKIEGEAAELEIWGAKNYRFGDKLRRRGIRETAVPAGEGRVRQERWRSTQWGLRHGILDRVVIEQAELATSGPYVKGRVLGDGSVVPLTFPLSDAVP